MSGVVGALGLVSVAVLVAGGGVGRDGGRHGGAQSGLPTASSGASPSETAPSGGGIVGRGPTVVDFTDPLNGWVASGNVRLPQGNPTIVRTTDGGLTWERTSVPNLAAQSVAYETRRAFGALVGIDFVSPVRGWFYQSGIGWQTNDAGTRWAKMKLPVRGALVAITSSGHDVWALIDTCPVGGLSYDNAETGVSCSKGVAKAFVYHASSQQTLRWRQVGGAVPAGFGTLYARADHSVDVALGPFDYRRSVRHPSRNTVTTGCESVGPLDNGALAGVCGGSGGGNASTSTIAASGNNSTSWRTLLGGPLSSQFIGTLTTNGADTIFYVTGGQTLWRTTTSQPRWQSVLQVPAGSTDEIDPVYVDGAHGYALVSSGLDAHWFETTNDGVSWEATTLP
jgi:hypothetical protein